MHTEILEWLRLSARPLVSVAPCETTADLLPLKELFEDVRVIGLGEATHGTSEFFTMKHRLVRFLVEELGFTIFAMEASLAACRALNEYVLGGPGETRALLRGLGFWTWSTVEVVELVDWLREHNSKAEPERRVRFVGFDVQGVQSAPPDLLAYLAVVAPAYAAAVEPTLQAALTALGQRPTDDPHELEERRSIWSALQTLVDRLTTGRSAFAARTSPEATAEAIRLATNLLRSFDTYGIPQPNGTAQRDRYMAESIREELSAAGDQSKMILWAHNGHVATTDFNDHPSMGGYLRQWFDERYYVIGFALGQGSFWARDGKGGRLAQFKVGAAPAGFFEAYCAEADLGNAFVDLKAAPRGAKVATWIAEPVPMRGTGAVVLAENPGIEATALLDGYDALIYIPETTCTRPAP